MNYLCMERIPALEAASICPYPGHASENILIFLKSKNGTALGTVFKVTADDTLETRLVPT